MRARARRNVLVAVTVGAAAAAAVRVLRGGPAPAFVGPAPDVPRLVPDPPAPAPAPEPAETPESPKADRPAGATPERRDDAAAPGSGSEPAPGTDAPARPAGAGVRWAHPVDGGCPPGHPIKVKLRSGIFHAPGMLAYDRTVPDRCYATADDAAADGFRPAKR